MPKESPIKPVAGVAEKPESPTPAPHTNKLSRRTFLGGSLFALFSSLFGGKLASMATELHSHLERKRKEAEILRTGVIDMSNPEFWQTVRTQEGETIKVLQVDRLPFYDLEQHMLVNETQQSIKLDFSQVPESVIYMTQVAKRLRIINLAMGDTTYAHHDTDAICIGFRGSFEIEDADKIFSAYHPSTKRFAMRVFQFFGEINRPSSAVINNLVITDIPWFNLHCNDRETTQGRPRNAVSAQPAAIGLENSSFTGDNIHICPSYRTDIVAHGMTREEAIQDWGSRFGISGEVNFCSGIAVINIPDYDASLSDAQLEGVLSQEPTHIRVTNSSIVTPWDGISVQALQTAVEVTNSNIVTLNEVVTRDRFFTELGMNNELPFVNSGAGVSIFRWIDE